MELKPSNLFYKAIMDIDTLSKKFNCSNDNLPFITYYDLLTDSLTDYNGDDLIIEVIPECDDDELAWFKVLSLSDKLKIEGFKTEIQWSVVNDSVFPLYLLASKRVSFNQLSVDEIASSMCKTPPFIRHYNFPEIRNTAYFEAFESNKGLLNAELKGLSPQDYYFSILKKKFESDCIA